MHIRSNSAPTTPAQAVPPSLATSDDSSNAETRYQVEHTGPQGATTKYDTRRSGANQEIGQPWLLWQNPPSGGSNSGLNRGKAWIQVFFSTPNVTRCSCSPAA